MRSINAVLEVVEAMKISLEQIEDKDRGINSNNVLVLS